MKDWSRARWIIFAAPFALAALGLLLARLSAGAVRSRLAMEKSLAADGDIHEWLIVFGWSRKALYLPTVAASLLAAAMAWLDPQGPVGRSAGPLWMAIFLVNFLIDEYELSVRVLATSVLTAGAAAIWLFSLDWLDDAVRALGLLRIEINPCGYLLLGGLFLAATGVSWLAGLFHYAVFTPNYMNLQSGMSESGEQIAREHYATRIDTGDFLERLLGFGWIIVTFTDPSRAPLRLLVSKVGSKAARLESIRGKIAIDD